MIERCNKCGYDFLEYLKSGVNPETCPNCFTDVRHQVLDKWEIQCTVCGADLIDACYKSKIQGYSIEECPQCGGDLKSSWERNKAPDKKGCPYCGTDLEDIGIEGAINFRSLGRRQNEQYIVHGSNGLELQINLKCGRCGALLNYDLTKEYNDLQNRLLQTFKVGDM